MSLTVKQLSYQHPNHDLLFQNINLSLSKGEKASLIGNNGTGKSTFLRIISGNLSSSEGEIIVPSKPYYVPQHFGQYNNLTIAQALGVQEKLSALNAIELGDASEENFNILNEDWSIEERSLAALNRWGLDYLGLDHELKSLSGGERSKVFLSGIDIHSPELIFLDEPTNHLDSKARQQLYDFIDNSRATILVVSHDRTLLNLLNLTFELSFNGIKTYGGNYEFYKIEKQAEIEALQAKLDEKEKALRLAKKVARESMERQQKHDVRGEKKNAKKGIARIVMGNLKSSAEKSTAKMKEIHSDKMQSVAEDLSQLRDQLPESKDLKLDIEDARLHSGKLLIEIKEMNHSYGEEMLWKSNLNLQIRSGERIAVSGANGSGKTTLIHLILGKLEATTGCLFNADFTSFYIDQEYSLLNNDMTIYEQTLEFNTKNLFEHEIKTILNRFLFPKETWEKKISQLSGGEKIRLLICCLQINNRMPDMIILDEPTNNLDINSLDILTSTIQSYKGTLIVISHDSYFLQDIAVSKHLELE